MTKSENTIGNDGVVFMAYILMELRKEFPVPIILDRRQGLHSLKGFTERDNKAQQNMRELNDREVFGNACKEAILSNNPNISQAEREQLMIAIEGGGNNMILNQRPEAVQSFKNWEKRLNEIWDGSLRFLKAEGYIREIDDDKLQLTEKGLGQLHLCFAETKLISMKTNATVIGRLTTLLAGPKNYEMAVKMFLTMFVKKIMSGGIL